MRQEDTGILGTLGQVGGAVVGGIYGGPGGAAAGAEAGGRIGGAVGDVMGGQPERAVERIPAIADTKRLYGLMMGEEEDEKPAEDQGSEPDALERYIMQVLEKMMKQRNEGELSRGFHGDSGEVRRGTRAANLFRGVDFGFDEQDDVLRRRSVGPARRPRFV